MWWSVVILIGSLVPALAAGEDHYRVSVDDQLARVRVEACFAGAPPKQLRRHSDAAAYTDWIRGPNGAIRNRGRDGRLDLGDLPDDACIEWQVDLARAAARRDYRLALDTGEAVVTDGDLWFWRDNERRDLTVEAELPPDMALSVPWRSLPAINGHPRFRPEPTSAAWSSRIAVGRLAARRVTVGGTDLRLAVMGARDERQVEIYAQWVRETARSVASITGRFPQHEPQILVIALGHQREAVPWAHVLRGGGVAIEFFVDGHRSLDELRSDWTATHEFSHLLLPYVSGRDRWLSEGLASYYQNVLRARDGRLDEVQAWQKLRSGFQRGERATHGGSLASATRSGWGATMRVYWSGAAMMLKADAKLRALSGGRQSLDTALAALSDCCHDPARRWRARELFQRLDDLTGHRVFSDLYREHVPDDAFPDMSETWERLGVIPDAHGVRLDRDAPWSRIRHFIMNEPVSGVSSGAGGES